MAYIQFPTLPTVRIGFHYVNVFFTTTLHKQYTLHKPNQSSIDFQSQKVRNLVLESHKNPSETAHLHKSLTTPLGNHNPIQELLPKDNHSPLESNPVQTNNKDQFRIHMDV
ncbi:hypothetical protein Fmac_024673 [Flemingia macrophylla]|uniref:Uncharacterized protein n=1 Tax=Flemingia macrophylla TaxID=520843 RepID=A0ABD1LQ38_9FABA